jgi:Zn-dependent M32 family carboxypeptidase
MNVNHSALLEQLANAQKRIAELEEALLLTEVCAELDMADLRSELAEKTGATNEKVTFASTRHELKELIEAAIGNTNTKDFGTESVSVVWREMIRLAKLDPKPENVIGYLADTKCITYRGKRFYSRKDERPDQFSREALAEAFRRRRNAHANTR